MHDPQPSSPGPDPRVPGDPAIPQPPQPPSLMADSPTEPVMPVFAAVAPTTPAPAVPAPPAPAAWVRPTFAATEPAPPAQKATTGRRSSSAGLVVAAVIATAVLTSGGTVITMSATGFGRPVVTQAPVITPAVAGSIGQPSQAPVAQAPVATPGAPAPIAQAPAAGGQVSVVDIVKAVSPAVVTIVAEGVSETDPITGMSGGGTATGSGVIFDANGLILTNHHVVAGNPSKLTVNLKDGRSFDATVYGTDTLTDLAIVKVDASGLPTAPIGDSSTIQVGQQAIAIGSPLGEFTDSVTSGIISAIGRSIPVSTGTLTNLIQTDTAINPGNSGGPLLDPAGSVIGINTAIAGGSQGIGFAIPINIARPLLAQASAGQALARPWLGVRFVSITPAIKKANSLTADNGAWISAKSAVQQDPTGQGANPLDPFGQVPGLGDPNAGPAAPESAIVAGGPAEKAGLMEGDIITAVDGTSLDGPHPLDMVMSQHAPGQTVTLDVLRDGRTIQVQVTLATRPATS